MVHTAIRRKSVNLQVSNQNGGEIAIRRFITAADKSVFGASVTDYKNSQRTARRRRTFENSPF